MSRTRAPEVDRPRAVSRGHIGTIRTGSSGVDIIDASGTEADGITSIELSGLTVYDLGDGHAQIVSGSGSSGTSLSPTASISASKALGNPAFAFAAIPEGKIIQVGSTYYCPYMDNANINATFKLATASSPSGPWSAGTTIYQASNVPWISSPAVGTGIYAPFILQDSSGTFYLYYSCIQSGGTTDPTNAIGVATATAVTGPYTDSGAALLSPSTAGQWDSRRVGEVSVIYQAGQYVMMYMGENSSAAYSASEKVGVATAPTPTGAWTRAAGNPLIDFGAASSGYHALVADPDIFYSNGYYWALFTGSDTANPSTILQAFLAYATTPTGTWTVLSGPLLAVGANGSWDDTYAFRGSITEIGGVFYGVYAGYDGSTQIEGGNFSLNATGSSTALRAADIPIDDVGAYYTGTDVEAALQEIGAELATSPVAAVLAGIDQHVHIVDEQFSGDGSTTSFDLANTAVDDTVIAYVGGTRTTVTLSGSLNDTITFGSAPTSGTNNISVDYASPLSL